MVCLRVHPGGVIKLCYPDKGQCQLDGLGQIIVVIIQLGKQLKPSVRHIIPSSSTGVGGTLLQAATSVGRSCESLTTRYQQKCRHDSCQAQGA